MLEFVEGELTNEECWDKIVEGCDYVLHVASPVFMTTKDEKKVLEQAVNGTRNVLQACVKHKIRKVVVTSSVSAVCGGREK